MKLSFLELHYDLLDNKYRKGLFDWDKVTRLSTKLMEWDKINNMKEVKENV